MAGIRLQGLSRAFGGTEVFTQGAEGPRARLEIPGPGLVALVGANGSGKTTLLRILATLTAPTAGTAWVAGASIREAPEKVRARIGYVPASDGGFFKRLTGDENLALFGGLRGLDAARIRETVEAWSEVLPLGEARVTPFHLASAGMRQALLICRALLHDPEVVLLDEPTRSLDPDAARALGASLRALAERKTVLLSTHRETEWRQADRIWEIRDGKLGELPGGDSSKRERSARADADVECREKPLASH